MPRRRKAACARPAESRLRKTSYLVRPDLEVTISELVDPPHKYEFPAITGNSVWDAGIHLSRWLSTEEGCEVVRGRRCVELGAGLGLVGITAACCGASVVLTDLAPNLPATQDNIRLNGSQILSAGGAVAAESFDWLKCQAGGEEAAAEIRRVVEALGGAPEVLLAADLTWSQGLCPPLLTAIVALAATQLGRRPVELYIAHTSRHGWGTAGKDVEGEATFHLAPLLRAAGFECIAETSIGDQHGTYIWHYIARALAAP
eukprot:TRINITY_DN43634_c0_g1_i2.p1 TRINITY_DN43634_c0_g1~~TRINITY_DN43634_c0_g1_i2.p1  ORF type:complete len:259 (-),score=42.51 TRINITY_DN43634_c0_g1_i2:859-1635(-)